MWNREYFRATNQIFNSFSRKRGRLSISISNIQLHEMWKCSNIRAINLAQSFQMFIWGRKKGGKWNISSYKIHKLIKSPKKFNYLDAAFLRVLATVYSSIDFSADSMNLWIYLWVEPNTAHHFSVAIHSTIFDVFFLCHFCSVFFLCVYRFRVNFSSLEFKKRTTEWILFGIFYFKEKEK